MEYLITLMFLGFAIFNLRASKGKKIRIAIKPFLNIILLATGIFYLVLTYKIGRGIESCLAAISALFYLYTLNYCQGIGEDGIFVLLGKSTIREISFADIKNIKIDQENYKLEIYADSNIYKQDYNKEDFGTVLELLDNVR